MGGEGGKDDGVDVPTFVTKPYTHTGTEQKNRVTALIFCMAVVLIRNCEHD